MIAIVYPEFSGIQGIARYIDSFLRNLPENHPKIYLIINDDQSRPCHYPGVEVIRIPFVKSRGSQFAWALEAKRTVEKLKETGKIKVVNIHWPPLINNLFLPKNTPILLTSHTTYLGMTGKFYPVQHFQSQWGLIPRTIKMWMEKYIFSKTHKVIALTEQGKKEVLQYKYSGPISVIPNGADLTQFIKDSTVPKEFDVIFSGRIENRKGSRGVAPVCEALLKRDPKVRIVIVGYGDDDQHVQAELKKLGGNITFTGKVPFQEMISFYNRSRVYASTSYYEGLPGTCLEAMAMGLPPVVWNFDFYRGLVEDGRSGRTIGINDYDRMAEAILDILGSPEKEKSFGEVSTQILRGKYDWKNLAQSIVSELTELANEKTAA